MTEPSTTAYLLLDVAGHPLALAQRAVREVLPLPHLHAPPATGGPLAGFLDLGGEAIPVIDLAALLGLREATPPDPYAHLVLTAAGAAALLVDKAADLVRASDGDVQPLDGARSFNGCIDARIVMRGRHYDRIDLPRLLTAEESSRIAAYAAIARHRLDALDAAIVPS